MRPRMSVVIPCYNTAEYVAEAIESALAQTLNEIEVIVVDDGSTDAFATAVDPFCRDPRVRVVEQGNHGISAARNAAITLASGEYVGLLDADDRWSPSKAARHAAHMDSDASCDLSFSWCCLIDERGKNTGRRFAPSQSRYSLGDLILRNVTGTASAIVFRRSVLARTGNFDTRLRACEDLDLWLRIADLRAGNVHCIPELLTGYRIRSGQLTSNFELMRSEWLQVMAWERVRHPELVARYESAAIAEHARYMAFVAYQAGDARTARTQMIAAWRENPLTMAGQRRGWTTSAAVLSTYLPGRWSTGLEAFVDSWRRRRADSEDFA